MKRNLFCLGVFLTFVFAVLAQNRSPSPGTADFDVIIKGGTVYDGTGAEPKQVDVAIRGDRIAGIGDFRTAKAKTVIDANALAVAPGFVNMLSWSTQSLIQDGRSQSEIRQGVTTEIMGEGESMGPVNDRVREHMLREQTDIKYDIKWNTLAEYLRYLETRGVSCNVASFIGATTIREYVIGFEDKAPTPEQLEQMRRLVRKEMEAGALGIGTSLIYPPAFYAKTEELIELCKVAAKYQGKYISHMRSEGNRLLEALGELIRISREAGIPAEVGKGSDEWENNYVGAGSPDRILLVGFKSEKLKPLTGKSLAEIAKMRGKDPITTIMDLILEDQSRIESIYFLMSEENVKKELAKRWISFGSDEASQAPESVFLKSNPHPRAYGNFARLLGTYVSDEKVIPLKEAIRRLSGLPATNLGLDHRGFIKECSLISLCSIRQRSPIAPRTRSRTNTLSG